MGGGSVSNTIFLDPGLGAPPKTTLELILVRPVVMMMVMMMMLTMMMMMTMMIMMQMMTMMTMMMMTPDPKPVKPEMLMILD